MGRAAYFELLYGAEDTSSEDRGRSVPRSGNGVLSDLPLWIPLPPVELLPPDASGGYLRGGARMPRGADSSPTSPAGFGAPSDSAILCATLLFMMLGGFHPEEAPERIEVKRRSLLG